MMTTHPAHGFTSATMGSALDARDTRAFRTHTTSPFMFRRDGGLLGIEFAHNGKPVRIGRVSTQEGELVISTQDGLGDDVHAAIAGLAPQLERILRTWALESAARREQLVAEALEVMGPRDQNRKSVQLDVPRREFLTLGFFGGYLNAALHAPLTVSHAERITNMSTHLHISARDAEGRREPIFKIKCGNAHLTLESSIEDEKPRKMFVEDLLTIMRARRDRVINDPALHAALEQVRVPDEEAPLFARNARAARTVAYYDYGSDYMGLASDNPYAYGSYGKKDTFVRAEVAPGLSGVIMVNPSRASFCGIDFQGQPVGTQVGILSGVQDPATAYYGVYEATVRARPDLLIREARDMGIAIPQEETLLARSLADALRGQFEDPDADVISL